MCQSRRTWSRQTVDDPMPPVVIDMVVEQIVDELVLEFHQGIAEQILDLAVLAVKEELPDCCAS